MHDDYPVLNRWTSQTAGACTHRRNAVSYCAWDHSFVHGSDPGAPYHAYLKPGTFEQPAIQLDLHATSLAAAGLELKPEWKLDRVNLLPFLTGSKPGTPHEALYWRFGDQMAIRMNDFKLVRYDVNADTLSGDRHQGATSAKLYNLREDVGETKDLSASMPDKVAELQAKWDAWNTGNINPLWRGATGDSDGAEPGAPAKKAKRKKAKKE